MNLILSSETARLLDVSIATVHQWERTGRLFALKTSNGTRLFNRDDVLRLKAERDRAAAGV
jgi:DNA-binding transcriptional MerR regulator